MTLVLVDGDQTTVVPRVPEGDATAEHPLRDLVYERPEIVPVAQLEPEIGTVVSVAKELNLPGAGLIDVLLVSEFGRLVIVECKLWRNPQARREVIGQVLDYARELARYAYEDLQRVISNRLGRRGNVLYELARAAGSTIGEAAFVDRVARDLATGRFLLLVAGDGITEGMQRIGEYLRAQPGLAFDLGLMEIAEYRFFDPVLGIDRRILQPRLLARTAIVDRFVIRGEVPGIVVEQEARSNAPRRASGGAPPAAWRAFVDRFTEHLELDDPAQVPPRVGGLNWMRLPMPSDLAVTLYRSGNPGEIGAFLRFRGPDARLAFEAIETERAAITAEFAGAGLDGLQWHDDEDPRVSISWPSPVPWDREREDEQQAWFARAANQFVNSLRPRLLRLGE